MEIPSLSAANQALTLVGSITELVKKGTTIELQDKIVSLKEAVLALKEENLSLRERLSDAELRNKTKLDLVFETPCYYLRRADGTKDGLFCQVCQDTKSASIRLQVIEPGSWKCEACNTYFQTADYKRQSDERLAELNRKNASRFSIL